MTEIAWLLFLSCISAKVNTMCEGDKACYEQAYTCSLDEGQLCYPNGMDIVVKGNTCRQYIEDIYE